MEHIPYDQIKTKKPGDVIKFSAMENKRFNKMKDKLLTLASVFFRVVEIIGLACDRKRN